MTSTLLGLTGGMFQPFQEADTNNITNPKIIIADGLNLSLNAAEQVLTELTQYHIFVKNSKGQALKAQLNFSTKFEVVLQNQDLVKSKKIGFRLVRQNCEEKVCFYHSNPQIVEKWVKSLRTLINQCGFHKYFKAIRRLGKGQFATVFEVESFQTGHKFAVKGFSKVNLKRISKGIESLLNQIKIMRSFTHRNLQKLEGVYETENSIYLVNQLLKGGSLFDRLQKINQSKKKINLENIREFMSGLLQGLSHLSDKGIVHRDLKLDNIVLRRMDSFEPVIIDFGLATFSDQEQYLYYRCGTPGYVSPEVMTSMKSNKIDPISDIFSAGAIFHHLLTERPIFPGATPEQVLIQNKSFSFNFNSDIYLSINSEAFNLLTKMLEIDPKSRVKAEQATLHLFLTAGDKINSPALTTICESEKLICQYQKF